MPCRRRAAVHALGHPLESSDLGEAIHYTPDEARQVA